MNKLKIIILCIVPVICFGQSEPELIPVRKDSLWGYCNRDKKIIIEPSYDEVTFFQYGYAVVRKAEIYTLIDKKGNQKFSGPYQNFTIYDKDLLLLKDEKCACGFVDFKGNSVVPVKYGHCNYYKGYITVKSGKSFLFFDKKGTLLNTVKDVSDYYDFYFTNKPSLKETASISINGKKGIISYKGQEIIPPIYDRIYDFHNDNYIVVRDNKTGIIDRKGKIVHEFDLDTIFVYFDYWGQKIAKRDNKYGLINSKGQEVLPFIYDNLGRVDCGSHFLFAALKNGKWGVVDSLNNIKTPFDYESEKFPSVSISTQWSYNPPFYNAGFNNKSGLVNKNYEQVVPFIYDGIETFEGDYAKVRKGELYGYVNRKGIEVIPCNYKQLGNVIHNMVPVVGKRNIIIGYVDFNGREYYSGVPPVRDTRKRYYDPDAP